MATVVRRVSRDGTVTFQVRVRVHGERPRSRTFNRKTDAKLWAADVEARLGRGAFVPTSVDRRRTLSDLVAAYLVDGLPFARHNRNAPDVTRMLRWWVDTIGYVTLDKLTASTIAEARAELAKRVGHNGRTISGSTTNRYLAALSAACKWAANERHWLPLNPVLAVSKRAENVEGAGRALSADERARLLQACRDDPDSNILCAVELALATGCRYSNIRFLTWADVDLDRMMFRVERTKNGERRIVPIVGPAQAAIRAQYVADPTGSGWVFKGRTDAAPAVIYTAWDRVRRAAGLRQFRFHDLRHTCATRLAETGASAVEIADVLGHHTLAMALRYGRHIESAHRREVMERALKVAS